MKAYVLSLCLFLMGTSQTGRVFAMTAAAHPEAIRRLVLLYPAFHIPEEMAACTNSIRMPLSAVARGTGLALYGDDFGAAADFMSEQWNQREA